MPRQRAASKLSRGFVTACACWLGGAVLLLVADAAQASKITGKVSGFEWLETPGLLRARDPATFAFSFREVTPSVPARFRRPYPLITKELAVALIAIDVAAPQTKTTRRVNVSGGRSTPVTIVVAPGTPIEFKNVDPFEHRLYGVGVEDFKASETAEGGVRLWTPKQPGVFEIRDEVTTSLQSWVVVEPAVVATGHPDLAGTFTVEHDVPGTYRLQAYFAGKPVGAAYELRIGTIDLDVRAAPLVVASEKKSKN